MTNRRSKHPHKKKSEEFQLIAKERIKKLFEQGVEMFNTDSRFSDRYIELARKIAMKLNIPFLKSQKRKFCKHCKSYLVPGVNSVHRTNPKEKAASGKTRRLRPGNREKGSVRTLMQRNILAI